MWTFFSIIPWIRSSCSSVSLPLCFNTRPAFILSLHSLSNHPGHPAEGWGVWSHQVPHWGERVRGRGLLRRPGWLWGERYPGDEDQSLHFLQGLPLPLDVWSGPHTYAVWKCHLQGPATGTVLLPCAFICSWDLAHDVIRASNRFIIK